MNFLIILFILALNQVIKSEIPFEPKVQTTNTEVTNKNEIISKKEEILPTAVVAAVRAKTVPAEIKPYDDSVIRKDINDVNKRQQQQEVLLKLLIEDVAFIKKSLIKIFSKNPVWKVIQRRQDGSVNFDRNWEDYKNGFGDSEGEFFIGLEELHEMTSGDPQFLLIIMEDFENKTRYALYSKFKIASEEDKYAIEELGDYTGDAGDSMSYHRSRKFSTKDQDNDNNPTSNCAKDYKGGWWFDNCYSSNLNGPYYRGPRSCRGGINWYHWHNYVYSLKSVEMMIRPAAEEEQ